MVVRLRSGGPDMTVERPSMAGSNVAVVWFDEARCEPCQATFPAESLSLSELESEVTRLKAMIAVERGALAALTDATATYDHEIVKAAFVWSQAHDGIGGGLDEARQALFEAVERRRALEES